MLNFAKTHELRRGLNLRENCVQSVSRCLLCHHFIYLLRVIFSPQAAIAPSGPGPPHYRRFTITFRHNTPGRIPLDEGSAQRRDLYLPTYNNHKRHIHAPGDIRTHNLRTRAAANEVLDRTATGIVHYGRYLDRMRQDDGDEKYVCKHLDESTNSQFHYGEFV